MQGKQSYCCLRSCHVLYKINITAADVTGAVRQQKRAAPKREPKAGRGGRGGRGRGRAAAAEAAGAAAPDKAWQTARLSRSGVPLAKQLKVLPGVFAQQGEPRVGASLEPSTAVCALLGALGSLCLHE